MLNYIPLQLNWSSLHQLAFISCRFQILRDLMPNSDQKRDKASFLLEVQYIKLKVINNYDPFAD